VLKESDIKFSMEKERDGRDREAALGHGNGRRIENVFIESMWYSVKYEEIHIREYNSVRELVHY